MVSQRDKKAINQLKEDIDYFENLSEISSTGDKEQYKKIITVEEHFIDGGFGSWLLEALHEANISTEIPIVKPVAYNSSIYDKTGTTEELIMQSEIKKEICSALRS